MNTKLKSPGLALLALVGGLHCTSALAELVVIANPASKITKISRNEVIDLYTGQSDSLASGDEVMVVDQAAQSPSRQQFIKSPLNMSEGDLKSRWAKLIFSGKIEPLKVLASDQEVKAWVSNNTDAIGYIDRKEADNSVKVLLVLP